MGVSLPVPLAPFENLDVSPGRSITVNTTGKVLVLHTGNPDILPLFNEKTLNPNRLSITESPFGGLKGSTVPDYMPGTVNIVQGDGVYLQDTAGTNSSKTLGAGKLKELGLLTVDTVAHSITEEFAVANTNLSNDPTVIDDFSTSTGWSIVDGDITGGGITTSTNKITCVGHATSTGESNASHRIKKTFNITGITQTLIKFTIRNSQNCTLSLSIFSAVGSHYSIWGTGKYPIVANTDTIFILPIKAPQGTTGQTPTTVVSFDPTSIYQIYIGVAGINASSFNTFTISDFIFNSAKSAYIELQTPDNLAATSAQIYTHNGTTYQLCSTHSLDSNYSLVSQISGNCTLADATKFDDVYGTGLGRAVFPKGTAEQNVSGSVESMTYSVNKGTRNRIGIRVDLPSSDNGRTNFNKVRLKVVTFYTIGLDGKSSASFEFFNSTNTSYGLQNISRPLITIFDPANNIADFYLFNHRLKNLISKRDESGNIYELTLYPGNGIIEWGRIDYNNLTKDSNSDLVPDFLTDSISGSLTKFLKPCGMVID